MTALIGRMWARVTAALHHKRRILLANASEAVKTGGEVTAGTREGVKYRVIQDIGETP